MSTRGSSGPNALASMPRPLNTPALASRAGVIADNDECSRVGYVDACTKAQGSFTHARATTPPHTQGSLGAVCS